MNDADVLFPWEKDGGEDAQDYAPDVEGAEETAVDAERARHDRVIDETGTSAEAAVDASPAADAQSEVGTPADDVVPSDDEEAASAAAVTPDGVAADADAGTSPAAPAPEAAADEAADDEAADDEGRFEVLDTEYARRAAERASAALRENPIAQKEYYSISEVCELVGLKPHVLRYWETQFQVLNPSKNRSGNRVYQRKEIRLITLVKHLLYEEKYTVEGAKAKLDRLRRGGELAETAGTVLDRAMIEQLRADLSELTTLLTPPART